MRQVVQLAEQQPGRVVGIGAGQRPDGGDRAGRPGPIRHAGTSARPAVVIVAEPRTRSPSYITSAWPAATPCCAAWSAACTVVPSTVTVAGLVMPCARSCTAHRNRGSGAAPAVHTTRPAV